MADASTLVLAASSTEMLEYILFEGEREPEDGLYDRKAIATTIQGTGAIQWAAAVNGDLDVVRALLRWGADVNDVAMVDLVGDPRESENGPALHKVLNTMLWEFGSCEDEEKPNKDIEKYFDMITFLLKNGADPNIKNQRGLDAWELAGKLENAHKTRLAEILKPERPGEVDRGTRP
jgi:ankyrin repeat protein